MAEGVEISADGPVRLVTLDRPAQLNAADAGLHHRLATIWDDLRADAEARVVVLTGAGRAFSAGGDLGFIRDQLEDPELRARTIAEAQKIVWSMIRFPLPIIAAVNGAAVGLGCSLTLCADIVLAAEEASFADPHVGIGLVCGDGGAALMPLVVPLMRAKEFLFTGDRITSAVAHQLGMVNRVVPAAELLPAALALAHRIAAQPREALEETKRAVQLGVERAISGVVEAAAAAELRTMGSEEHRARMLAILDRRR